MKGDARAILGAMLRRAGAVRRELTAAARVLGPELNAASKRLMQTEIYNVPVPRGKGGRPRWRRSGGLKRSEGFRTVGPVLLLTNNARYARARFRLGTGEGRPIVSPGVRSIQWQVRAVTDNRERVLQVRRRAVLKALRG